MKPRVNLSVVLVCALLLAAGGRPPLTGAVNAADPAGTPGTEQVPDGLSPEGWQAIQTQVVRLIPGDVGGGWLFGASVSVRGDVALVGAPRAQVDGHVDQGAAYVFYRDQGGTDAWGQVTKLTASDGAARDEFGHFVSLSGDTAIIGAPRADLGDLHYVGAAYIFYRDEGGPDAWGEVAKITASDGAEGDCFGSDVWVDGDTALVGAPCATVGGFTYAGAAYFFYRNQGGADHWGQVVKLTAPYAIRTGAFGAGVSASGDVAVIGAPAAVVGHRYYAGIAHVFYRNQGGTDHWGQVATLMDPDGSESDKFGTSVSVGGDTVLIGAPGANIGNNLHQGAAYVFYRNQGGADAWGQVAKLAFEAHGRLRANFGCSVSLSGDTAVVGADKLPVGGNQWQGAAYVFSRNQGGADVWGQVEKLTLWWGVRGDQLGGAVSVDGTMAVVGAPGAFGYSGAASVFGLQSLHLRSLELAWEHGAQPGTYRIAATVRVHNDHHARTGGVTVQGDWTLPDGSMRHKTGVTNGEGEARFSLWVTHAGSYQFCVTDLAKAGYGYDPGANEVPACQSIVVGP